MVLIRVHPLKYVLTCHFQAWDAFCKRKAERKNIISYTAVSASADQCGLLFLVTSSLFGLRGPDKRHTQVNNILRLSHAPVFSLGPPLPLPAASHKSAKWSPILQPKFRRGRVEAVGGTWDTLVVGSCTLQNAKGK